MIRLCLPPFFASELFLPKMETLHAIMPDTDIRITTQPSVMNDHPAEADLSVLLGTGEWEGLMTYPLFARRLVIAAAPSQLEDFDRSSFASLDGQTLIVHENRPNAWSNWAMEIDLPEPSAGNILRFDSMSSVVQAAAQGLGFAIIPLPMSQNWFKSGTLIKVFDTEWVTDEQFYLAHRTEELNRPELIEFIQWHVKEFKNYG